MNPKIRDTVLSMNLMSDVFFNAFMSNNNEGMQYILRIIMERNDLVVKKIETQQTIPALFSRGVRFDVFATDSKGNEYDFEVQQESSGAIPERGRYNSSMMDYMKLNQGQGWKELPNAYVIFITATDVIGGKLPIYHIDRRINEMNYASYGDRSQIIYVNGAYILPEGQPETELVNLIHDFHCADATMMKSKILADRMKFLKGSEEEMNKMCKEVEKYANNIMTEAFDELAIKMLKADEPIEKIMDYAHVTMDKIVALKATLSH